MTIEVGGDWLLHPCYIIIMQDWKIIYSIYTWPWNEASEIWSVRRVQTANKAIHQGGWRETEAELFGVKSDGWRCGGREMRGRGLADMWEDREVWWWAEGNPWEEGKDGRNKERGMRREEREMAALRRLAFLDRVDETEGEWWWGSWSYKSKKRENVSAREEPVNAYRVCFTPIWLMRLFTGCKQCRI